MTLLPQTLEKEKTHLALRWHEGRSEPTDTAPAPLPGSPYLTPVPAEAGLSQSRPGGTSHQQSFPASPHYYISRWTGSEGPRLAGAEAELVSCKTMRDTSAEKVTI